jgi:hypothetical protein
MIEENTVQLAADPDEPSLEEVLKDDFKDKEEREDVQRRLEWAGVHTVSQLRNLQRRNGEQILQKYTQLPVNRLRAALMRASQPRVLQIMPEGLGNGHENGGTKGAPLLRIRGQNLMSERQPAVRIAGEAVPVLQASERELLIAPRAHQLSGTLAVEVEPGNVVEAEFDLSQEEANPKKGK